MLQARLVAASYNLYVMSNVLLAMLHVLQDVLESLEYTTCTYEMKWEVYYIMNLCPDSWELLDPTTTQSKL